MEAERLKKDLKIEFNFTTDAKNESLYDHRVKMKNELEQMREMYEPCIDQTIAEDPIVIRQRVLERFKYDFKVKVFPPFENFSTTCILKSSSTFKLQSKMRDILDFTIVIIDLCIQDADMNLCERRQTEFKRKTGRFGKGHGTFDFSSKHWEVIERSSKIFNWIYEKNNMRIYMKNAEIERNIPNECFLRDRPESARWLQEWKCVAKALTDIVVETFGENNVYNFADTENQKNLINLL